MKLPLVAAVTAALLITPATRAQDDPKEKAFADRAARALAVEAAREKAGDCLNTSGATPDINNCMSREMKTTDANYKSYVLALGGLIRLRTAGDADPPDAAKKFDAAEAQWALYRKAECDGVYQTWVSGTIRGLMYGTCMQTLERQHMRDLDKIYAWN